jgi:ABC-type uncharacterized transport system involved in gliding motility auxiliary subunit
MNKKLLSGAGILLAVVLFFALNIAASVGLKGARLDLTENRLYTLSDGTKNLLRNLKEPIRLRLFFSKSMSADVPQLSAYGDRVREFLERFRDMSNGRITLEVIDPEPFSDAEDRAVAAGLQGIERDGRNFYFGLVGTNEVDSQEFIPFFQADREEFLEYDLTKVIYTLTVPKKPEVGVISAFPLEFGPGGMMAAMRGQSRPYAIMSQLRQFFQVKTLEPTIDRVPESVAVLVVIHPRSLEPQAVYAIDQFVLRGGRVIAFVDPHAETAAQIPDMSGRPPPPGSDMSSNLPDLFKAWGVEFDPKTFVGDIGLAQRVTMGQGKVVDYVGWLAVPPASMSRDDVITGQLNTLNLASVGALKPAQGATTTFTPLLSSSDRAMLIPVEKLQGQPDPLGLLAEMKPTGERYTIAARIAGPVKTAFPNGAPPVAKKEDAKPDEKQEPLPAHLIESKQPASILVFADADLIDDRFWVQEQGIFGGRMLIPMAANGDLLVNAVDNLSGSNDLIGLRSRGRSQRPFDRIEAMRRDAAAQFQAREQALRKQLTETERKITELQSKNPGNAGNLVSAEEQAEIDRFRQQLVLTRQELRGVQRDLNRDIQQVDTWIKFVNIGLIPILVAVLAVIMAATQRRRRRHRPARA